MRFCSRRTTCHSVMGYENTGQASRSRETLLFGTLIFARPFSGGAARYSMTCVRVTKQSNRCDLYHCFEE